MADIISKFRDKDAMLFAEVDKLKSGKAESFNTIYDLSELELECDENKYCCYYVLINAYYVPEHENISESFLHVYGVIGDENQNPYLEKRAYGSDDEELYDVDASNNYYAVCYNWPYPH